MFGISVTFMTCLTHWNSLTLSLSRSHWPWNHNEMKNQQTLMLKQINDQNAKIEELQSQIESLEVENVLDSKNIIENSIAPSVFRIKVKLNRLKDRLVHELNDVTPFIKKQEIIFFLRKKSVYNSKFFCYDFVGVNLFDRWIHFSFWFVYWMKKNENKRISVETPKYHKTIFGSKSSYLIFNVCSCLANSVCHRIVTKRSN